MSVSEDLQQLSMVELLPHLLGAGNATYSDQVVPNKLQAVPNGGPEFHMIAANTFRTILEEKLVPPSTFTQTFLPSIVASIECRDPCTSEAWLNTLLDIIELLPTDVVRNDVLPIAIARGQLSQSTQSRVSSCKLIGKIASKFDSSQLRKEIVPLVHSLCQDVSGEVRASMCHQLPHIAQGLSYDALKPDLLPLFVDFAIDEEPAVRLAAVHTISSVISTLPGDVLKHTIVPLIMKVCDQALTAEDSVLCAIAEKYGPLCHGMSGILSENDRVWFLQYFKTLARLGVSKTMDVYDMKNVSEYIREKEHCDFLMQCRQNAAANFPAVVQFCGPTLFEEVLYSTFAALICDQSSNVRSSMAGGIHEVFSELGSKCHLIQSEVIFLLTDDSRDVLQSLVPHLQAILQHLTKNGVIGPSVADPLAHELMRAFLKCELVLSLSNDWRLHSAMLRQLEFMAGAFPSDLIFSNICGVLFHRMQDSRALPCRLAAAHALLILLRHTSKVEHCNEIRNRIFTELCIHHSCHVRLLFVKMCGMALDVFSSFYIKDHFFLRLLSLAGDPVPNVRLVLCGLLPRLKRLLKMPQDSNLMSALQDAVERLQNSVRPDRDVSSKLHLVCLEMDHMSCDTLSEAANAEDLLRYQEEQEIEMKYSTPEPRRLVTVNMKTLGEGKRATLVSLRCPDITRSEFRQSSGNNVAVSSYGVQGGYPNMESKITASISSTTCDPSHSFTSLVSAQNDAASSSNSSAYPVLREEEFYIDAGVPLPEKLTDMKLTSTNFSCTDPARSKIPNLRELLFQNSTLLAQVANREAASQRETSLKSASYLKTNSPSSSPASATSKRYSRLFAENSSVSDLQHLSLISKPSSSGGARRETPSSSGLSRTNQENYSEGSSVQLCNKEIQYNSKVLPSTSQRLSPLRRDSKITNPTRRSFVYTSTQVDGGSAKNGHIMISERQRGLDGPQSPCSSYLDNSQDCSDVPSSFTKLRIEIPTKVSTSFSQSALSHSHSAISKVSVPKLSFSETPLPCHTPLETSDPHGKPKAQIKFSNGYAPNKRFSMKERTQGPPSQIEKKVSLSSIGVNGVRRPYHSGSRPQSCLILTQNDKGGKVNARSLSQESLGLEHNKIASRVPNRNSQGTSRIPRGGGAGGSSGQGQMQGRVGTSCHSSPGNSRSVSPVRMVSRTAPCSPGGSRSTSPDSRSQVRVSLASIKLHEPSKLPIRKYNHHV